MTTPEAPTNTPAFHRSLFGKCDAEVKLRITSESKFKLQSLAHSLGMSESEFVRELIDFRIWGGDHVRRMAEARVLAVGGVLAGEGDNGFTEGGQS